MKKITSILLMLYSLASFGQDYHYYRNKIQVLHPIPNHLCITIKEGGEELIDKLSAFEIHIYEEDGDKKYVFMETHNDRTYTDVYNLCIMDNRVESVSPVFGQASSRHGVACASRVAVRLHNHISDSNLECVLNKYGLSVVAHSGIDSMLYVLSTNDKDGTSALRIAEKLRTEEIFRAISPDFLRISRNLETSPNDPLYGNQWNIYDDFGIKSNLAWTITKGHASIVIASIDSGVELDHPDLIGNLVWGFDAGNPNSTNPGYHAGNKHGTKCAGVAVAKQNNQLGISGIAPNCRLMPIRRRSRSSVIHDAIYYATIH